MLKTKKNKLAIALLVTISVFSASAYASSSACSFYAQLKCMAGMAEFCAICEIR